MNSQNSHSPQGQQNPSTGPTRIVIVGAGYTGVWAYKFLRKGIGKLIKRGDVEVSVICPKDYHSFHGFTAEALCGILSIANRQSPLRLIMPGVHHIRAHAESVDLEGRKVIIRTVAGELTQVVPYDHLILANGSYDVMEPVTGLRQHGWSLKEPGGVLSTRNQIMQMIEYSEADTTHTGEALTFVIGGGGLAGVEMAANIAEWLHNLGKLYPLLKENKHRVVLVHSGPVLLPQFRPRFNRLADYATRQLEKWGVEIIYNSRLRRIRKNSVELSNGTSIPTRTVISTIGQRTTIIPGTETLPHSANGLIVTDQFLHVQGYANVWAAGDTAQVRHISSGQPVTANALWAIMGGVWLGGNVARAIQGKPLRMFSYRGLGQSASLGVGKGASELYGMQFTGWIGWLLRFFFFLYFVPSRRQAIRITFDWLMYPFIGRYQTSMQSIADHALAAKRVKESTATMEMAAVVIEQQ